MASLREFLRKIRPTELSCVIRESSSVALAIFGEANVWRFSRKLIQGAVRASLVGGACFLITPFDVVIFASEVFHAFIVDGVGYV